MATVSHKMQFSALHIYHYPEIDITNRLYKQRTKQKIIAKRLIYNLGFGALS